jgi:putative FmdB family regulatory protein
MPLFEYRCDKCGKRFSLLVGVTRDKPKLECPRCRSKKARKLISRVAPIVREEDVDDLGDLDDDFGDESDYEGEDDGADDNGDDFDED